MTRAKVSTAYFDAPGSFVIEHGLDVVLRNLAEVYEESPDRPEVKPGANYRFYVVAVEKE